MCEWYFAVIVEQPTLGTGSVPGVDIVKVVPNYPDSHQPFCERHHAIDVALCSQVYCEICYNRLERWGALTPVEGRMSAAIGVAIGATERNEKYFLGRQKTKSWTKSKLL